MRTSRIVLLNLSGLALAALAARPLALEDQIRVAAGYHKRGAAAFKVGNLGKAEELFRKAIGYYAGLPEAHMGLGHVAMAREQFDSALREYTLAGDCFEKMEKDFFAAQVDTYTRAQHEKWVVEDLHRQLESPNSAVKLSPTRQLMWATALEGRAQQLGHIDLPAPSGPPQVPGDFHFHMGNALFRLGRLDEALAEWETARERSPDFAPIHNNLAVAYWKAGRIEEARESLAHAESLGLRVNPSFKAELVASGSP